MAISCDHPRPKLNLPGRTPQRLPFNAPTFIPTSSPADMARALLEAFRGISAALAQIGQRRTVVPLIEDLEAREGQIITGVADGQIIKLPEAVQDGAIGQVTILLSDVKTPVTVVHPDGTTDPLSEPGIYEFALGSEGEETWATPPGVVGGIRAISAGTTSATSGTVRFSNGSGVSFGMAGNVVTASVAPVIVIGGNGTSSNIGTLSFANAGGISWTLAPFGGSALIAGSVNPQIGLLSHVAGNSVTNVTRLAFSNANNVFFGLSTAAGAATLTASVTVASTADPQIGLVSHVAGNSVSSVTRLVFSNASNVTWDVSTGANAATIRASVAAGGGGADGGVFASAAGSSQTAGQVVWSNSNNVSFGMNGSTITASAAMLLSAGTTSSLASFFRFQNSNAIAFGMNGATITAIADSGISGISAGTLGLGAAVTGLSFSNANNVSWTLSTNAGTPGAAFVLASVTVASTQGSIRITAGTTNNLVSNFSFSNGSGVSFGINGSTITASVATGFLVAAGGFANTLAMLSFSNLNGVSFGLAGSTVTASVAPVIELVSHVGGNSVADVTRLAFSNASNVTFSLSTAVGGATVLASVDVGGGGIAISAPGGAITSGSALFTSTLVGASSILSENNVWFSRNGQEISAGAALRLISPSNAGGAGTAELFQRLSFSDANGISWGHSRSSDVGGERTVIVTASFARPDVAYWRNVSENDIVAVNLNGFIGSLWAFPLGMQPFPGNMTLDTLEVLHGGLGDLTTNSPQWGMTLRGGLYSLNNSTQLSRVNSFSTVFSSVALAAANSQTRNNLYGGFRWLTLGTNAWGASPVLSDGVNYWLAVAWTTSGTQVITQVLVQRPPAAVPSLGGVMGVSSATASPAQRGFIPFNGRINTTSPPTTIGTADILSSANATAWFIPILQLRDGIGI